jgi:hypothetical protein
MSFNKRSVPGIVHRGCQEHTSGCAIYAAECRRMRRSQEAAVHLVQILLPLFDGDGRPVESSLFAVARNELVERFGGATAFTRAPAEGYWVDRNRTVRDDILVIEVVVDTVDGPWWRTYRKQLEARFRQDEVMIRHHPVERI